MTSTLQTDVVMRAVDKMTAPLTAMANKALGIHNRVQAGLSKVSGTISGSAAAGSAAISAGIMGMAHSTQEFNASMWGVNAAFLGSTDAATPFEESLKTAKTQTEAMRLEALRLSKVMGLMPEEFAKAGEEASKMGLGFDKSKAIMNVAGLVQMSDKDAKAGEVAKGLGTYGMIYGAEKDAEAYAKQVKERGSMLALAGAQTRTSASKIEEGMRNVQGIHGAFGGKFEDAIAMLAMASDTGQLDKESGTAIKSLMGRFLNMPALGRTAMADLDGMIKADQTGNGKEATGIRDFMDFKAADPRRATDQLINLFPQRMGKSARGNLMQFFEKAKRDGRMGDPNIVNETLQAMEKQGLHLAGAEDRDQASSKIGAVLTGAGGNFDVFKLMQWIAKLSAQGKASPAIMGLLGEPKRLHQYAAMLKVFEQTVALRDKLVEDKGRFIDLIARGYKDTDAAKLVQFEAAVRRVQLSFMRTQGIQNFMGSLERLMGVVENANPKFVEMAGWGMVLGLVAGPAMMAGRALMLVGVGGLRAVSGIMWMASYPFVRAAAGLTSVAAGMGTIGMANMGAGLGGLARLVSLLGKVAGVGLVIGLGSLLFDLDKLGSLPGVTELGKQFGELGTTIEGIGVSLAKLFGMDPKGGPLLTGVSMVAGALSGTLNATNQALRVMNGKPAIEGGGGDDGQEPEYDAMGSPTGNRIPRLVQPDASTKQPTADEIRAATAQGAAEGAARGAAEGAARGAAEGVKAGMSGVTLNVNVGGGTGGKASAPTPTRSNAHEGQ